MTPLRIFIGWDSREPIAFQVACHSILRRASKPVAIIPLALDNLKGIYERPPNGTTEFSLSRFLVPYLSNYEGVSVFMDCDMLVKADIHSLFPLHRAGVPPEVWACQHDYEPREGLKATGVQTKYPRKNWSSFMVFENSMCRMLTPEYVNSASPADLHRMAWAKNVGGIPIGWNWLVGEYHKNADAPNMHYTLGTPCFSAYK
jgi:hypothetical protein